MSTSCTLAPITIARWLAMLLGPLFLLSYWPAISIASEPEIDALNWRSIDNQDVTCLAFFLELHGKRVDFNDLASRKTSPQGFSLAELCRMAGAYHVDLAIGKQAPSRNGLNESAWPIIAVCNDSQYLTSYLVVVLASTEKTLTIFSAPTATIETISKSDFLRCWSGKVVYARNRSIGRHVIWLVAVGAMLYLGSILSFRWMKGRQQ